MNALHAIDDYVDLLLSPAEPPGAPGTPATADAEPAPVALPASGAPVALPSGGTSAASPASATPSATPRRDLPAGGQGAGTSRPEAAGTPLPPASSTPAPLARWLRLRCGEQTYALELLKIREVVLPAPLLPLRGAAPALRGVMNLRGQVVPVIDLGLHFGGGRSEVTPATRIIVLEERNEVLGLQVSSVEDIVLLDEAGVENPRASRLAPVGDQRIRGIARLAGQVMLLLDASRLIATPLH